MALSMRYPFQLFQKVSVRFIQNLNLQTPSLLLQFFKGFFDCLLEAPKNSRLLRFVSSELSKTSASTTDLNSTNFVGLAITRDRLVHKIELSQPLYITIIS
jgi:hypothetical protein